MKFEKFLKCVEKISKSDSKKLRKDYIEKFIDTGTDYYKKNIRVLQNFSDGVCYTGYLWDCLLNPKLISFKDILSISKRINKKVYVFWDIHSKDRIFISNYWRFGKDTILNLDFTTLLDNLDYLPEDIYIFDENMDWTLILTHECIDEEWYCLKSGEVLA